MTINVSNMPQARPRTAVSPQLRAASLKIAYTIQNVGLDLSQRVGDVVPVRSTLDGLKAAGHQVDVFALQERTVARLADVNRLDQTQNAPLGLTGKRPFLLAESGVRRLQGALGAPYFAFFDSWRFYDAMRRSLIAYDLCHEHNGLFSPASALACRRLQKPYVLTFSADPIFESALVGRPLTGIHLRVAAWAARLTYTRADQIICVSEPARQHLVKTWRVDPQKIHVMPNGVDVALFGGDYDAAAVRAEWGLGDAPVISFVGGFQPWHGLENLIESFAHIRQEMPTVRLMLVGDGPARASLERKIAECGVGEAAIITGLLPQERVPQMLSVADVAVIPYPQLPQELWFSPLKLYEYMAAGKAIVASRAGQIAEVLEDGRTGLLVESGDIPQLTGAILALLADPDRRQMLGDNARRQAVARHSWTHYIQKLEKIYENALVSRKGKE